jgi:glutamate/tyrosine decarboxylase-like PLP-dependent enzyme
MSPPHADYLQYSATQQRDQVHWVAEYSRRARGFAAYAALRSLGRAGVAEIVERCCGVAAHIAAALGEEPGVEILNEVVLNQALVRFHPRAGSAGDADEMTREVIRRVQASGELWLAGTVWHGVAAMRISVSNWSTAAADAERAATTIIAAYRDARAATRDHGTLDGDGEA